MNHRENKPQHSLILPGTDKYGSAPVPLYFRVKEYLKQQIESGVLRTGDQIPTEEQLSKSFQISRMTVRRAISDLVREGRLIRRQGIGTFVAEPVIDRQLARLTTLTEEFKQRGYDRLHSKILNWKIHRAQRYLAELLGIETAEPILRIRRIRYTGEVPIAVQTLYLPEKFTRGLVQSDIKERSMYEIMEEKLNQPVEWAKQKIDAVAAAKFYARWLEVETGSPLFKVTRQAFLADGRPLDIVKTYYRPDRYSFHINLYRSRD